MFLKAPARGKAVELSLEMQRTRLRPLHAGCAAVFSGA
jgi:hypothetical protein